MRNIKEISAAIKSYLTISGEASIKWCSDKEIQELNYQFRGINKPTNVLSFPSQENNPPRLRGGGEGGSGGGKAVYLGDIAISLETVRREAQEQGKEFEHHLTHMIVHGILHLMGYDHEQDAQAEKMEALEIAILQDLGIANPFRG